MKPGDKVLAPPPYIGNQKVEATFLGPAPPIDLSDEIGRTEGAMIPRVYVEREGQRYPVEASTVEPLKGP